MSRLFDRFGRPLEVAYERRAIGFVERTVPAQEPETLALAPAFSPQFTARWHGTGGTRHLDVHDGGERP